MLSRPAAPTLVRTVVALILGVIVAGPVPTGAAPGDLDRSFGDCGVVKTHQVSLWTALALQPDGKIVTYRQFELGRYAPPIGLLDPTFGEDGIVHGNFPIVSGNGSIEVQPDGRIVLASGRLLADGSPDVSFVTDDNPRPEAASVQSDGKIVVAGTHGLPSTCVDSEDPDLRAIFRLTRFAADGTPDPNFGNGGLVDTDVDPGGDPCLDHFVTALAIQPDDRIVVVGTLSDFRGFVVVRYDRDGLLDPTFGTGGVVRLAGDSGTWATDVAIAGDGRVVVAGVYISPDRNLAVLRLDEDGTPDATFGTGGLATVATDAFIGAATQLAVQPNGKIVVAGHGALLRLGADGTSDAGFGQGGVVAAGDGPVSLDVAIQPDGRIVTAGIVYLDDDLSHGGSAMVARYTAASPATSRTIHSRVVNRVRPPCAATASRSAAARNATRARGNGVGGIVLHVDLPPAARMPRRAPLRELQ